MRETKTKTTGAYGIRYLNRSGLTQMKSEPDFYSLPRDGQIAEEH